MGCRYPCTMKKILWVLSSVVVLVLVLFVTALTRLDSEALGASAIEQIRLQSGIDLQAERSTLHPLRGLQLENVTAVADAPVGRVHATIDQLSIEHRLLPLLWGEVVMNEVQLERPMVTLVSKPAKRRRVDKSGRQRRERAAERGGGVPAETKPEASQTEEGHTARLSIETLGVEDGVLTARTNDSAADDLRVEQIDLQLRRLKFDPQAENSTLAVSGSGRFTSGRIDYGDFAAERSSGRVGLDQGRAEIVDFRVSSVNGELSVPQLEMQLDRDPLQYELGAAGSLDLNGILGVAEGGRFGPMGLDLTATGKGPELRAMRGRGTLTLEAGSLPGFPAMIQIEDLLGRALLTGREYETTAIEYELVDNRLVFAPFELVGDGGNVGGSGAVDLGGMLDLDVYVRLPRETLEIGVVDEEHLATLEDDQGMVQIPFTLSGTFEDPSIGMEWEGIQELMQGAGRSWAERALEEAAEKAKEWLSSQQGDPDSDRD